MSLSISASDNEILVANHPIDITSDFEESIDSQNKNPKSFPSEDRRDSTSQNSRDSPSEDRRDSTSQNSRDNLSEDRRDSRSQNSRHSESEDPRDSSSQNPKDSPSQDASDSTSENPKDSPNRYPRDNTNKDPRDNLSQDPKNNLMQKPSDRPSKDQKHNPSQDLINELSCRRSNRKRRKINYKPLKQNYRVELPAKKTKRPGRPRMNSQKSTSESDAKSGSKTQNRLLEQIDVMDQEPDIFSQQVHHQGKPADSYDRLLLELLDNADQDTINNVINSLIQDQDPPNLDNTVKSAADVADTVPTTEYSSHSADIPTSISNMQSLPATVQTKPLAMVGNEGGMIMEGLINTGICQTSCFLIPININDLSLISGLPAGTQIAQINAPPGAIILPVNSPGMTMLPLNNHHSNPPSNLSIINMSSNNLPSNIHSNNLPSNNLFSNLPSNNLPNNNLPSNNLPSNNLPSNNLPSNLHSNNLPSNNLPSNLHSNNLPSNNLPSNNLPSNNLSSNNLPSNNLPSNNLSSNNLPSNLPRDDSPDSNNVPIYNMPNYLPKYHSSNLHINPPSNLSSDLPRVIPLGTLINELNNNSTNPDKKHPPNTDTVIPTSRYTAHAPIDTSSESKHLGNIPKVGDCKVVEATTSVTEPSGDSGVCVDIPNQSFPVKSEKDVQTVDIKVEPCDCPTTVSNKSSGIIIEPSISCNDVSTNKNIIPNTNSTANNPTSNIPNINAASSINNESSINSASSINAVPCINAAPSINKTKNLDEVPFTFKGPAANELPSTSSFIEPVPEKPEEGQLEKLLLVLQGSDKLPDILNQLSCEEMLTMVDILAKSESDTSVTMALLNSLVTGSAHPELVSGEEDEDFIHVQSSMDTSNPDPEKSTKCIICGMVFTQNAEFASHMRQHLFMHRYSCYECGYGTSSMNELLLHKSHNHDGDLTNLSSEILEKGAQKKGKRLISTELDNTVTKCPVCDLEIRLFELSRHMSVHRAEPDDKTSPKYRCKMRCSLCHAFVADKSELARHSLHHGLLDNLQCFYCTEMVLSAPSLRSHTSYKHPGTVKPPTYQCNACTRSFSGNYHLQRHIKTVHEHRRDFKCPECDKCFVELHCLRRHIRNIHNQIRDHTCPVCSRGFTYRQDMFRHIMSVHQKIKDIKCPLCEKTFYHRYFIGHAARVHDLLVKYRDGICYVYDDLGNVIHKIT